MRPIAPCFLLQRASLLAAACLTAPLVSGAPVAITASTGTYTQDFNTLPLAQANWADDSTIPGWYAAYANAATPIVRVSAGATGDNAGGLYSYGASATDPDRALGSQGANAIATSGQPAIYYGVVFQNTTASPVALSTIAYAGEQWRNGGNATAQSLKCEYETSATSPTLADTSWIEIASLKFTSPVTGATTAPVDGNGAGRVALTSSPSIVVPAGQYAMIRWTDVNDSGNDHGLAIDDLSVSWTPSTGDTTKPTVGTFSPADDATSVSSDFTTQLSITFGENVQAGTGNVVLKKASDNSNVQTFGIADLSTTVFEGNKVTFSLPDGTPFLSPGTAYYVQIPATAIKDLAGNTYLGITDTATWNFSTPTPVAPTVVVNKYNSATDEVELLAIGTGVPGSTVDLRGMIIKDFATSITSDGGGSYTFSTDSHWAAVPAGTLIDLTNNATTTDFDPTDFSMTVGLQDPTYFTTGPGTFDISSSEMVMIKAAGSPVAGTTGGIHALAGAASAGSYYIDFPGAKLIAPSGTPNVAVTNSTSALVDYMTDFVHSDALAGNTSDFGSPNTATNALYIANLRGTVLGNGDGVAFTTNLTPGSVYNGTGVFAPSQTGQTAKITLNAYLPDVNLGKVTIVVPSTLGVPGTVTLSGAGSTGATASKSGQTITITGASATAADALEVTITGLSTPASPAGLTDTGNYNFTVSTSTTSGTPTAMASQPAVVIPIPIASLRDVDISGNALDLGETVAVTGVVTEENFTTTAGQTSAYIQDSTAGINIFTSTANLGLVRGTRYTVVGKVTQFSGLTELVPASPTSVINMGVATEPLPEVVTLATLLANAEAYEGKLITVQGLTRQAADTTLWGIASTVTVQDSGGTTVDVFIQSGSTATTEPTYPADITGIFGQHDTSSPYTGNYELQPRVASDLVSGTTPPTSSYSTWATANGITGESATADHDKDGLTNLLEYALGLNPTATNGSPGVFNAATKTITFTKGTEAVANADVTYVIQTSPDMVNWTTATSTSDATSISFTLPAGQTKIFARLIVTQAP